MTNVTCLVGLGTIIVIPWNMVKYTSRHESYWASSLWLQLYPGLRLLTLDIGSHIFSEERLRCITHLGNASTYKVLWAYRSSINIEREKSRKRKIEREELKKLFKQWWVLRAFKWNEKNRIEKKKTWHNCSLVNFFPHLQLTFNVMLVLGIWHSG